MKILAPVNEVYETEALIKAGANEIYCGVFPKGPVSQFGYNAFPNTRGSKGNLKSYSHLREVVSICRSFSVPVFLTLNGSGYTQRLYPMIFKQIENAKRAGVGALIVVDVGLLLALKKEKTGLDIHIGTGGVSFNSQTVKFYEDLGASRIVLPRDARVDEVSGIIKDNRSVKFEAIILRSGCRYVDGLCWFSHHLEEIFGGSSSKGSFACRLEYGLSFLDKKQRRGKNGHSMLRSNILAAFRAPYFSDPCGVCRIKEFDDMGLYGVKITGRGHQTKQKLDDVRFVRSVISLLDKRKTGKKDFGDLVMKTRRQIYGADCNKSCYYP